MQTKKSFGVIAIVLMLATVAVMSFAVSMDTYAQNTTQTSELADNQSTATTNMTNSTGLASGIIDDDDDDDTYEEEGPGEDEDEPGDIDENDEED